MADIEVVYPIKIDRVFTAREVNMILTALRVYEGMAPSEMDEEIAATMRREIVAEMIEKGWG